MPNIRPGAITLDPHNLDNSLTALAAIYDLDLTDRDVLRRVIAFYPQPVCMYLDEASIILHERMPLGDKFTFDMETDDLILYSRSKDALIDALIEMAMYLAGFSTMMGSDASWVVEFTIGAWKPVKKRIRRQLGLPVQDQPRGVVGLPPSPEEDTDQNAYPFRTLVSNYDLASFHQMVLLAARDDIAVYFPPETHSKVLAVYVYMRRAMQEVAQGIDLADYATFNSRLIQEIQRLEKLFNPSGLSLPNWLHDRHASPPRPPSSYQSPRADTPETNHTPSDPFETFIEQLFAEDDDSDPPTIT